MISLSILNTLMDFPVLTAMMEMATAGQAPSQIKDLGSSLRNIIGVFIMVILGFRLLAMMQQRQYAQVIVLVLIGGLVYFIVMDTGDGLFKWLQAIFKGLFPTT